MKKVLCVDIGGTRIKTSVLPKSLCFEMLKSRPVFVMRTLGWLNRSLPELLSPENWASIVNQKGIEDDFTEIAICVPGPVRNGEFLRNDLEVPKDLGHQFSRFTDKGITLVKDADAWMIGATAYSDLANEEIPYPALGLTFGTGVGLSAARDSRRFVSLEISGWAKQFHALETASGHPIEESWQVHRIVGNPFLEWVASEKRHWSYLRIRDEFSKRVAALINDIVPGLRLRIGKIKTVVIGGGNSEFVSLRMLRGETRCKIKSFWSRRISISPDLVPLIGLHKLVFQDDVHVES